MSEDTRNVYEKINDGVYENKLPWPGIKAKTELEKAQKKAYQEEDSRLAEMFYDDALEYVGLTGHPKADKIYSFAVEHGHAYGRAEVVSFLVELAYIFKD